MTDILDSIDEVIAAHESCGCGCGQRITDRSASPFYASEACQTRWMGQGKRVYPPTYPGQSVMTYRASRPRPSAEELSVYDVMPHIVDWLNANGIPAMDVPVAEVAQLHDGQIAVWTFERPRRVVNEEVARRLVTVPLVVAPPDALQPWLRGECRESVPFISADTAAVDAVLRSVAAVDPALDHSSHSMQWVGACPECVREEPSIRGVFFASEVDFDQYLDAITEPRRPWWRFW